MRGQARFGAIVTVLLALSGCSGSDGGTNGDGAGTADAGYDGAWEGGGGAAGDAASDADARDDVEPDASEAPDAGPDVETEADAADDAAPDAATDLDAEADAATDGESAEEDAATGEDGCALVAYYRDDDGDGYGGAVSVTACTAPSDGAFTTRGGDCNDDNADVHPGQTKYFEQPYTTKDAKSVSYDYDCDGKESGAPGFEARGEGTNCTVQEGGGSCSGGGYQAASPSRSGSGTYAYCGSTSLVACNYELVLPPIGYSCRPAVDEAAPPFRCR